MENGYPEIMIKNDDDNRSRVIEQEQRKENQILWN